MSRLNLASKTLSLWGRRGITTSESRVREAFLLTGSFLTFLSILALISVLPPISIWSLEEFLILGSAPLEDKYLCLLQALDFWDSGDFDNLIVLNTPSVSLTDVLLYVQPKPISTKSSSSEFEISLKQILFTSEEDVILSSADRSTLLRKLSGCP